MVLTIYSNAKINLNLRIVGHNGDFHLLQSYFYPINSLKDSLEIRIANSDKVTVSKETYIPQFTDTIIAKTIAIMRSQFSFKESFDIRLHKRIPIGGGLGGGSSNAAAIIYAIDRLLGLDLSIQQKCEISKRIGADVTFFIYNKPCIVEGFGEIVTSIKNHKDYHILIVVPDFSCSTTELFKLYRNSSKPFSKKVAHQELIEKICYNDLTDAACAYNPKILDIISKIAECKGCNGSGMSGSGSTCFGVFDNIADLEAAVDVIKIQYPKYYIT